MNMQSSERRKNPRAYIQALTLITPPSNKRSIISGWIHNISLDGAGVLAKKPSSFRGVIREGDEVRFRTQEDYFEFRGRGKVTWTSPQGDMVGIQFSQLGQRSREALEELLRLFPSFSVSIH
jgi:hypothetical protein